MSSNLLITFNLDNDVITTQGKEPQRFRIYQASPVKSDGQGGTIVEMSCIDQDNKRCNIRLRIEHNGNSQLYIDYADIIMAFNVIRIK